MRPLFMFVKVWVFIAHKSWIRELPFLGSVERTGAKQVQCTMRRFEGLNSIIISTNKKIKNYAFRFWLLNTHSSQNAFSASKLAGSMLLISISISSPIWKGVGMRRQNATL